MEMLGIQFIPIFHNEIQRGEKNTTPIVGVAELNSLQQILNKKKRFPSILGRRPPAGSDTRERVGRGRYISRSARTDTLLQRNLCAAPSALMLVADPSPRPEGCGYRLAALRAFNCFGCFSLLTSSTCF